ncbi:MAG: pyruvate kinase [Gammaproteobacteria bacterium]|nr:pyruvate kinase [Gammaproteobacteria bacterium]MDH3756789.1 pyruvate kinase [Gammaproteobacteria bacterium]MDH3847105.1 pyruvate kinase [Gammaproteobacteria bacterium]MDH3862535.1 pyruvate kinase [Gammaproteobacteria bacterium]MDH3907059.1 pyruvate kinase [Gammaproteobacteria bacterium]
MHRRTKIVATLGPATDRTKTLRKMIDAGLNVARLNFSHGDAADHRRRAEELRTAADECRRDVGLLGDLQGPKIRVQRFRDRAVELQDGASFFLDSSLGFEDGTEEGVGVALDTLHDDVAPGDTLLLNDGLISLHVDRIEGTRVHTTVINGGILSNHKGINKKGGGLSAPALTDIDRDNIKLAAELDMDFLAVSFVRDGDDVREARRLFEEAGGKGLIVAKIERVEAIEEIDSIIDAADIVMVARGDLGVEMGYAELTGIQKKLIRKTRKASKIVITATQMMESMIQNPIPTRAEVSDVSNAVMDGTDAVMLSGETAVGRYPVKAIRSMAEVCKGAEKYPLPEGVTRHRMGDNFGRVDEAIAMAVMYTANHLKVTAIIALTESGSTARWMSRIRSDIPIYALTPHAATGRRVTIYRGVIPVHFGADQTHGSPYRRVFDTLLSRNLASVGDYVIVTKGDVDGVSGGTNAMTIVQVTEAG